MDLTEWKKQHKTFLKTAQKVLAKEFQEFFKENSDVEAVRWTQYTPHFNDGDVCEFSRHEFAVRGADDAALIIGLERDEDDFYDPWDIRDTPLGKKLKLLDQAFSGETEDLFKHAFGDGVQVTATREGFNVEEFDHD